MKVLVVCHDHPQITDGGTEHVAHDLCRTLDALPGISARFLAASTALSHPDIAPGALHSMDRDLLLRTGRYDLLAMRRLDGLAWIASVEKVLEMTQPDVVHLHGLDRIGAEIVPLLRRLRPTARLVLTLHDFQLVCPDRGLLLRRDGGLCTRPAADACRQCLPETTIGALTLRKARLLAILEQVDAFIAPSRDLRDRFIAWGLPGDRIWVIPNAVPDSVARRTASRARPDRFAFFGNIASHKGVYVLLKAAERVAQRGTELRVTLHGRLNHPTAQTQRAFAAALGAAAPVAQHVGPYHRSQVQGLMAGADWVVLPSVWFENAPLVLLEARRAGLPVICTALGGMQELVSDGHDGVLVPRGDAAALAETMETLAKDPALWARMAENVRQPPGMDAFARQHFAPYFVPQEVLSA